MPDNNVLSDRMARKLQDMERILDSMTVTGDATFKKSGTSWSIHVRPAKVARRSQPAAAEESIGELDGQVHQMTSQNEDGWADLRLVNR